MIKELSLFDVSKHGLLNMAWLHCELCTESRRDVELRGERCRPDVHESGVYSVASGRLTRRASMVVKIGVSAAV